ncbi:hypothetical protein F9B74_09715 [Pelistega sp. NLN82]|uniref:Uncharacterized protein n=1 Tax=Pelistega ratti TaxID=2652177 RepID=A0A6L9Y7U0_9BURK|nr:hypothetical protein [Pelistega ratti]NEN76580.1 hypothetical protein [Pelistega ratti]
MVGIEIVLVLIKAFVLYLIIPLFLIRMVGDKIIAFLCIDREDQKSTDLLFMAIGIVVLVGISFLDSNVESMRRGFIIVSLSVIVAIILHKSILGFMVSNLDKEYIDSQKGKVLFFVLLFITVSVSTVITRKFYLLY